MTAPYARYRRAAAIPAGMAMATALAFLPNTAATAAEDAPAAGRREEEAAGYRLQATS